MFKSYRSLWMTVLTLACIAAFAAPADAAGRLKVVVPEPFEVDGEFYPAGTLTVRQIGQLSPIATLNKVCVEGSCLSYVFTESATDGEAERDELIFTRAADGHLIFESIGWNGEPVRGLYVDPTPAVVETSPAAMLAANGR